MKWYFASRTRHQKALRKVVQFLEDKDEKVTSEWLHNEILDVSYVDNLEETQSFAKEITSSLLETDVFVMISDAAGTDMFIELGVCLGLGKKTYIVGEHSKRSLMQLHPKIKHKNTIKDVLEAEGIACSDFVEPVLT